MIVGTKRPAHAGLNPERLVLNSSTHFLPPVGPFAALRLASDHARSRFDDGEACDGSTNITRRRSVKCFSIPPQHWIDRTTLRAAAQFTNTQTESTGNKLNATMLEFLGSRIRFRRIGRFAENLSEARHVQEIYGSGAVDTEVHGRVGSRTEPTALGFPVPSQLAK